MLLVVFVNFAVLRTRNNLLGIRMKHFKTRIRIWLLTIQMEEIGLRN